MTSWFSMKRMYALTACCWSVRPHLTYFSPPFTSPITTTALLVFREQPMERFVGEAYSRRF